MSIELNYHLPVFIHSFKTTLNEILFNFLFLFIIQYLFFFVKILQNNHYYYNMMLITSNCLLISIELFKYYCTTLLYTHDIPYTSCFWNLFVGLVLEDILV